MWKKETEEDRLKREAEIYNRWKKQQEIGQEQSRTESQRYYSDPKYRQQKDEHENRFNRILYGVLILLLILGFYQTCIKSNDKDPDKAEYEINQRLRLN